MVSNEIKHVLDELIELLISTDELNWSSALKSMRVQYGTVDSPVEQQRLLSDILRIYGGMGSFSDLVLYDSNNLLVAENERLDRLRSDLFSLAKDLR